MKIVILFFACVASLHFATGALDHELLHEHGHNQGLAAIHSFNIPPGSIIFIQKVRDGEYVPGHLVYGPLQPVARREQPSDDNDPYGHAFVIIDASNEFHARLRPGPAYPRNDTDQNNTPEEDPEYHCWIGRQAHFIFGATLLSLDEGHMHGIPHVHYRIDSRHIHVVGELHHLPPDDMAGRENQRTDVP